MSPGPVTAARAALDRRRARRRRTPRADAPRTIVPELTDAERAALARPAAVDAATGGLTADLDAARSRLRKATPRRRD